MAADAHPQAFVGLTDVDRFVFEIVKRVDAPASGAYRCAGPRLTPLQRGLHHLAEQLNVGSGELFSTNHPATACTSSEPRNAGARYCCAIQATTGTHTASPKPNITLLRLKSSN